MLANFQIKSPHYNGKGGGLGGGGARWRNHALFTVFITPNYPLFAVQTNWPIL